jgi:hypothetical protein
MKKLLICGDSFAADWTVKHEGHGWPNMLADTYKVTNIARAGVSEYKIHQQLASVNLFDFHVIIIAHTSPYRLYVKQHPIHSKDILHSDCDFIYNDIKANEEQHPELGSIVDYFEKYFDQDYAKFVHNLICEKIEKMVDGCRVIHLINFEDQYKFKNSMDFTSVFRTNRGLMNHFDEDGNKYVYQRLVRRISEL